jgi:hypothetical protein
MPMKYAISLQMGTLQSNQRPPQPYLSEEQKQKIRERLEQIKRMASHGQRYGSVIFVTAMTRCSQS